MAVVGAEAIIADALLYWASQLTTAPTTLVANPNVPFAPQIGVPYLAVTIMPNMADATGIEFGSDIDHEGMAQVSVFWPVGQGEVQPKQVAAQIVAHFARGTVIYRNGLGIRIEEQPTVRPMLSEADWAQIPVSIRWRCLAPDPSA